MRLRLRQSWLYLKRCAFQCIETSLKVWKWGFKKNQKVWNQIKIWTLTSLLIKLKSIDDRAPRNFNTILIIFDQTLDTIFWSKFWQRLRRTSWKARPWESKMYIPGRYLAFSQDLLYPLPSPPPPPHPPPNQDIPYTSICSTTYLYWGYPL